MSDELLFNIQHCHILSHFGVLGLNYPKFSTFRANVFALEHCAVKIMPWNSNDLVHLRGQAICR